MFRRTLAALLAALMVMSCFATLSIGSFAADYYVRGSVKSINPQSAVTVELKKDGETVYTDTIAASDGNGEVTQDFEITGVALDTYDLVVSKAGHLSATVKNVVVNGSITLSENEITLMAGDINDDGYIDASDVSYLVNDLGKTANEATLAETDITGDGYRDSVDVAMLSFNLLKTAPEQEYSEVTPDVPAEEEDEVMYRTFDFLDCDAKYASFGDGFSTVTSNDAPQGTGYYSATHASCPVILAKPNSPVDISDYVNNGYFTFKLYVDDVTNLKSGVGVDLWQGGQAVCTWSAIPAASLVNGWNDVTLYVADMTKDQADYTSIASFRIYAYSKSGNLTIGLDDIKVTAPYDPNANKFALTFDPGEGSGTAFTSDTVEKNGKIKLPECSFTKDGCSFIGWKGETFLYSPGYNYKVTANETLTAQWVAEDGDESSQFVLLESFDNKTSGTWWGSSALSNKTDSPIEGSAYLAGNDTANDSVICGVFASPLDLSEYKSDGVLKVSVYVEDASNVSNLRFEIANANSSNVASNTVYWTTSTVQNGWNTYSFKFTNTSLGNIDLTNVKYSRVILFTSGGAGNWGIDGLYVAHVGRDYATEYVMEKALSDYIVYGGSENANAAIASTMKKAEEGEDITIVAFGTSTLGGAGASEGNGWIHHATRWFEEKFPNATFTLVNSGIGSSESVLGSARFQKECLDHNPDIIFFEMGNNDNGLPHGEEAYEGILTQLVQSGTSVFALNSRRKDNSASTAAMRNPLNELYDIPTLDFNAYSDMYMSVNPPEGFSADELWSSDAVHPSNRGHQLMAELAIDYLEGIYSDYKAGTLTPASRSTALPTAKTENRYADSILYQNNMEDTAQYSFTLDGFTADFDAVYPIYHTDMDGWQADSVGDKITFKTTAGYFAMFFVTHAQGGTVKISVDGVQVATKDTYSASPGWPHTYNFTYHVNDGLEHTVEVEVIQSSHGSYVGLTSVTLANFAD